MLNQKLQLKLSQKLSPQQIQLMKLIQLPLQELEQRLAREIEENPALESGKEENYTDEEQDVNDTSKNDDEINIDDYFSDDDIPDYKLSSNNYSLDDDEKNLPFVSGISFNQSLTNQLQSFSLIDIDLEIAKFLVGSIDQIGYLRRDLEDIVDDLAFTCGINTSKKNIEKILETIHLLDPPGVGARDLKECLLIQLKRKKLSKDISNAIKILDSTFEMFSKKHFKKIIVKLNISLQDLSLFTKVNEIMLDYFEEPYPARAALQVARLPLDSLIEVEAIIIKEKS